MSVSAEETTNVDTSAVERCPRCGKTVGDSAIWTRHRVCPSCGFHAAIPAMQRIESLIDDALASADAEKMREALVELKRLQEPYLNWAGKAERTNFEVDTVSLHVHERIDPASILAAIRKRLKGEKDGGERAFQPGLFDAPFENLPLRQALDFY